jgi:hypothetical protein
MTTPIEEARRIVTARGNSLDHLEGLWIERDAVTVARFVVALVDAKDDLTELWEMANDAIERAGGEMEFTMEDMALAHPEATQRLIARIRAAEQMMRSHTKG